jgi:phage terminase large subunit-like protein
MHATPSPTTPSSQSSCAQKLADLPPAELEASIRGLTQEELEALFFDWPFWARPKQLAPPGNWTTWLLRAGRGFGKTRVGAEWVRGLVETETSGRIALVGATASDTRDIMVEGESGIMACSPPWFRPKFEPAKRRLTWPNGAIAVLYTADEPERLRGPQHDAAWADEIMAWRFMQEAYDNLQFGLRLGQHPRQLITSTPKPLKLLREIEADPNTVVTIGTTYENRDNLAPTFLSKVITKYEGTRLGRQELDAEILDDNPSALWKRADIEKGRITKDKMPTMRRIVVSNDPKVSSDPNSNEWGLIIGGLGEDGHAYVFDDRSLDKSTHACGEAAVKAYKDFNADRLVAEVNNGGDLVEDLMRSIDPNVSYRGVHASKGKFSRAEPVAALYEQGRVHHVGTFGALEDQMCDYDPTTAKRSPDRMDALVWLITELMLGDHESAIIDFLTGQKKDVAAKAAEERAKVTPFLHRE